MNQISAGVGGHGDPLGIDQGRRAVNRSSRERPDLNTQFDSGTPALRSRQVVRRMAFFVALADVNQRFGGEPRAARRRMARRLAKAATKGLAR